MRILISIIALFSVGMLSAQTTAQTPAPAQSYGKEQPRSQLIVYPTAVEATAAAVANSRYVTRITDWIPADNRFTTSFTVPFAWINRQVLLHIEGASADYEISINDKKVAYNANPQNPAEFNITKYTKEGRNTVEITLSKPSKLAPIEGWQQNPAPSIGSCWLMSQPTLRVRDVATRTWINKDNPQLATAEIAVTMKSEALNPRSSRLYYDLRSRTGETVSAGFKDFATDMRHEDTLRLLVQIPVNQLWSTDLPVQHTLLLRTQHEGRNEEFMEFRIGFRSLEVRDGKVSVNGIPVKLHAKEVSGEITPKEVDALREKGYNTLRLLPGKVSERLLDYCDGQGMYVITCAAVDSHKSGSSRRRGGNPSNDPAWSQAYVERAADSYHTTKRHPSVIAFSIGSKSANGICLYDSYITMKKNEELRPFIYPDAGGEWNSDKLITE